MTARILRAPSVAGLVAAQLQTAYRRFLNALDDFAKAKARNAVPEWELCRAQREIKRYRRLMHASRSLPPKAPSAGR